MKYSIKKGISILVVFTMIVGLIATRYQYAMADSQQSTKTSTRETTQKIELFKADFDTEEDVVSKIAFEVGGGTATMYVDDLSISYVKQVENEIKDVEVDFEYVNDNSWYFTLSDSSVVTGQYYNADILVDGKEQNVILEKQGNKLLIWKDFFNKTDTDKTSPKEKLEIKKDSIIYQINPDNSWTSPVTNGQKLKVKNPILVEKSGLNWKKKKFITYQNFENESDNTGKWRNQSPSLGTMEFVENPDDDSNHLLKYTVNGLSSGTATFDFHNGDVQTFEKDKTYILSYRYKSTASFHAYHANIDSGWTTYDPWLSPSNEWVTKTIEFKPNDSLTTFQIGFQLLADGTFYLDDFYIIEKEDVESIQIEFEKIDSSKTWNFTSNDIDILTGTFYHTTLLIDGKEQNIVIQNYNGKLVIWPSFFKAIDTSKSSPIESLEIKKDTILYQVNEKSWTTPEEDGQVLKFANDVSMVNTEVGWCHNENTVYQDFEDETAYTGKWRNQSPAKATMEFVKDSDDNSNHVLKYTVNGLTGGAATFDFHNGDVQIFEKGKTYTLSYRYKSTAPFHAYHANIDNGWNIYGEWVSTASEWTTKTIEFTPNESLGYFQIGFQLLGNGEFYLDDFKISTLDKEYVIDKTDSPVYYNVGNGNKYLVTSVDGAYTLTKDNEKIVETEIDTVGEYILTRAIDGTTYIQKIVLYKDGDVDGNSSFDIADLVAIKKLIGNKFTYSIAGTYSADLNRSGTIDDTDVRAVRYNIAHNVQTLKANTLLNGEMPIIGYDGPYNDTGLINDDVYSLIKDSGVNTVVSNGNEIGTKSEISNKILELSEKYGLKSYLMNGYTYDMENEYNITKKSERLSEITSKYDIYSSFAGYYIGDEPLLNTPGYNDEGVKTKMSLIEYQEPMNVLKGYTNINTYLNLLPYISGALNNDVLGTNSSTATYEAYEQYVKKASEIGLDYLSYDMYIVGNSGTNYKDYTNEFYKNLDWMRNISLGENKPYYAFVQVGTDFSETNSKKTTQNKLTTVKEMYLEANAALAMGAKGLSYYSIVQPAKYAASTDGTYDYYRSGIINAKGEANHGENNKADYDYYSAAQKINSYIKKVDEVLMNSTSMGVMTTSSSIQKQIDNAYIDANSEAAGVVTKISIKNSGTLGVGADKDFLVGCFDYYGRKAYMIVNTATEGDKIMGNTAGTTTPILTFDDTYSYSYIAMGDENWTTGTGSTFEYSKLQPGESVVIVVD